MKTENKNTAVVSKGNTHTLTQRRPLKVAQFYRYARYFKLKIEGFKMAICAKEADKNLTQEQTPKTPLIVQQSSPSYIDEWNMGDSYRTPQLFGEKDSKSSSCNNCDLDANALSLGM